MEIRLKNGNLLEILICSLFQMMYMIIRLVEIVILCRGRRRAVILLIVVVSESFVLDLRYLRIFFRFSTNFGPLDIRGYLEVGYSVQGFIDLCMEMALFLDGFRSSWLDSRCCLGF